MRDFRHIWRLLLLLVIELLGWQEETQPGRQRQRRLLEKETKKKFPRDVFWSQRTRWRVSSF
jgi:hypothetical protein